MGHRSRIGLMKCGIAGAALLLLGLSALAGAVCTERGPSANHDLEIQRIRDCLQMYSQDMPANSVLYTYGHEAKMKLIAEKSEAYFCAFEYARQKKSEEIRFRHLLKQAGYTDADAQRAVNVLNDVAYLSQLREQRDAALQAAPLDEQEQGRKAYDLAAYDKIYPGFLTNYPLTPAQELDNLQQVVSSPRVEGQIIGIRQNVDAHGDYNYTGQHLSNSTGGLGVYFGEDPITFLTHFGGRDFAAPSRRESGSSTSRTLTTRRARRWRGPASWFRLRAIRS